jgi:hypothetical protein
MNAANASATATLDALRQLDEQTVRQRLDDLEAEQRALRVVLRAVRERDRAKKTRRREAAHA